MNGILDALRETFTPNLTDLLERGEARPARSLGTRKKPSVALPCSVCGHPHAVIKGTEPRCAACLTLSAKMPCYSDPEKPQGSQGLMPCSTKGGGMGVLITPSFSHFWVREEKFDLVFLDTVHHTRIPVVNVDHVLSASAEMVMSIPIGEPYWWGVLQENDIYPTLEMLRTDSWEIAQDSMRFHTRFGVPPRTDTRASWSAVAQIKRNPEWTRMVRSIKRIQEQCPDQKKRESRLSALQWQDLPGFQDQLFVITDRALAASF